MKPRRLLVAALALLLGGAAFPAVAGAGEVVVGRGTSVTRSTTDWKSYFNSDMKKLTTHAATTTTFERGANDPVRVSGVPFDLAAASPIETKSVARTVARPTDPDFGSVEVESTSVDARGEEVRASFVLRDKSLMTPIVVGPMEGAGVRPPPREQTISGKLFVISSSTRTVEVEAIVVAPTFEDLIAARNLRDVTEPGTRLEKGTMRVLSPTGDAIGFYAGDVRRGDVVQFVEAR